MGRWMRRLIAGLTTALCLTGAATAGGQNETVAWRLEHVAGVKPDQARAFLTELQRTTGIRDRMAVCALVQYPLRHPDGPVRNADACQRRFAEVFTQDVTDAIAAQRFDALFVNADGAMVGDGQVWFAGVCAERNCPQPDLRVTAVNAGREPKR